MAGNTVVLGIYQSRAQFERGVEALRNAGFGSSSISALFPKGDQSREFALEKSSDGGAWRDPRARPGGQRRREHRQGDRGAMEGEPDRAASASPTGSPAPTRAPAMGVRRATGPRRMPRRPVGVREPLRMGTVERSLQLRRLQ
jgi:hypothetical protein